MRGMLFSLLCQQALKRKGRPSGLIGQYKPYLNSNDSPTRDVLKDYSGQGHDIQLYNFGYAFESGYGSWAFDFLDKKYSSLTTTGILMGDAKNITQNSFEYKPAKINETSFTYRGVYFAGGDSKDFKLLCEGISENDKLYIVPYNRSIEQQGFKVELNNGINNVSIKYLDDTYKYFAIVSESKYYDTFIKFREIPYYPGALVSDGVDDYGLCENFPILTKESGYTVVAIRKWLSVNSENHVFLSNSNKWNTGTLGTFNIERLSNEHKYETNTFGGSNSVSDVFNINNLFVIQKSNRYQDKTLTNIGSNPGQNILTLFCGAKIGAIWKSSIALYALEIYDHDLTDEEIEKVKEAMYEEYLTATNALQNHIIADYECYDKTNEDEDRDVLKDLSGNGHDIQLYNFGFAEGSGYGKYELSFKKLFIQVSRANVTSTNNTIHVSEILLSRTNFIENIFDDIILPSYKIKVSGLVGEQKLVYRSTEDSIRFEIDSDGIYTLPYGGENSKFLGFQCTVNGPCDITIEQIPEYQGALVSDGVDDYGVCNNFPILNKEDGFTILAIRKWLNTESDSDKIFLSNSAKWTAGSLGAFSMERINSSGTMCNLFGNANYVTDIFNPNTNLIYQTNNSYQGKTLTSIGTETGQDVIALFCNDEVNKSWNASVAFYKMVILNKNCTTEEIKFIAKQMVAKHKEKTGETIELNF